MKKFAAALLTLCLTTPVFAEYEVGELPGSVANNKGLVAYSVPLEFSSGINGIEPGLKVTYSQGASNGFLGLGFQLSGLHSISRCGASKHLDGFDGGVSFSSTDRFCMNGQRLVKIRGNQYRPEKDPTTKVTVHGSLVNPTYWRVWTKDGYMTQFGGSSDTVETRSNGNLRWNIKYRKDRYGNLINYKYTESEGFVYPKEIRYSNRRVEFHYSSTLHAIGNDFQTYSMGKPIKLSKRLGRIEQYVGDNKARIYKFNYDKVKNYSRIGSIVMCDGEEKCVPPTKFDWEDKPDNILVGQHDIVTTDEPKGYVIGDLNRDGWNDMCYYEEGLYCKLNLGKGNFGPARKWTTSLDLPVFAKDEVIPTLSLIDVNNDQWVDYCIFSETGLFCGLNSKQDSFNLGTYWSNTVTNEHAGRFIQWNKDKKIDLCRVGPDGAYCAPNEGNRFGLEIQVSEVNWILERDFKRHNIFGGFSSNQARTTKDDKQAKVPQPQFLDLNGDGYTDLCGITKNLTYDCQYGQFSSSSNVSLNSSTTTLISGLKLGDAKEFYSEKEQTKNLKIVGMLNRAWRYADVNADKLTDVCFRDEYQYVCAINTGATLLSPKKWADLPKTTWDKEFDYTPIVESSVMMDDRDRDGLADFCYVDAEQVYCHSNTTKGFGIRTKVATINADLDEVSKRIKGYSNPVRKVFGISTRVHTIYVQAAFGPFRQVSDLDGDSTPDDCYRSIIGITCIFSEGEPLARLASVTTGYGATTRIEYGFLQTDNLFEPTVSPQAGAFVVNPNHIVVSAIYRDNGIGGEVKTSYKYRGNQAHPEHGGLGYDAIVTTDEGTKVVSTQEFGINEDFQRYPSKTYTTLLGKTLSTSESTFTLVAGPHPNSRIQRLIESKQTSHDVDGTLLTTKTSKSEGHDQFEVPNKITETTAWDGGSYTQITENTYKNNMSTWLLSQPIKTVVTSSNNVGTVVKAAQFSYDSNTGAVKRHVVEPGTAHTKIIDYVRNSKGFITKTVTSASGQTASVTNTVDSQGRVTSVTNQLGHTVRTLNFDPICDSPTASQDANGLVVKTTYDSFCRTVKVENPDGTYVESFYEWSDGADAGIDYQNLGLVLGDRSKFMHTTQDSTGAWSVKYFDHLSRTVRTKALGSTGNDQTRVVIQDFAFDELGRDVGKTIPYFEGEFNGDRTYWGRNYFDEFGRVYRSVAPTETGLIESTFEYQGLTKTAYGPDGFKKESESDGLGNVVRITENDESTITRQYDVANNLVLSNTNGQVTTFKYDRFGNKTEMTDPVMGRWTYQYDALNRLIKETDAKGQIAQFKYDVLSRKVEEIRSDRTVKWVYDIASNGIGLLAVEDAPNAKRVFTYDNLSRPTVNTLSVDTENFATQIKYNTDGRASEVTHPSGLTLKYDYDTNGQVSRISVPRKDVWDFDYLQLENALAETATRIVELEEDAEKYRQKAQEFSTKSDEMYANYIEYMKRANVDQNTANTLYRAMQSTRRSAYQQRLIAYRYKRQANYYWRVFGNRWFKHQKTQGGSHVYEYKKCVKSNHKGCKRREHFRVTVPKWMTDTRTCFAWRKFGPRCVTGPAKSIQVGAVYDKWANHYYQKADQLSSLASSQRSQANKYRESAKELRQEAGDFLAKAKEYASAAREQSDMMAKATDELEHQFAAQQELQTTLDARLDDDTNVPLWVATGYDPMGRLEGELFGNGYVSRREFDPARGLLTRATTGFGGKLIRDLRYTFDDRANVTSKKGLIFGDNQSYVYDEYERIKNWQYKRGAISKSRSYQYDIHGNMTFKSDIGALTYTGNQLVSRAGQGGGSPYAYDQNGNLLSGDLRQYAWTSFNKVKSIQQPTVGSLSTLYDANEKRVKQTLNGRKTYYVSPSYEMTTEYVNGVYTRKMRHNIIVNGETVAVHEKALADGQKQVDKTAYIHRDGLGSSDLVTDNQGNVEFQQVYSPFGERIDLEEATRAQFKADDLRGFTGHEEVRGFGLINMNARFYDPKIGRFISPDVFVPDADNTQSYNRYSYVLNNPIKYSDPSGHFWMFALGAVIFTAAMTFEDPKIQMVGTIIGSILMGGGASALFESAIAQGATVQFTTSFISSGGDLQAGAKGAVLGALSASVTYAIGHGGSDGEGLFGGDVATGLGHAAAQGVFSELQGGSFRDGVYAGVIGKLGGTAATTWSPNSVVGQGVIVAVFAGLSAEASGDNSAEAMQRNVLSSVFVYLYNDTFYTVSDERRARDVAALTIFGKLADDAVAEYNSRYPGNPHSSRLRGTKIHQIFERKINEFRVKHKVLGRKFRAEISYLDGVKVPYGTSGSSRADGVYGNENRPQFVVELKTGISGTNSREVRKYLDNLPGEPALYLLKPKGIGRWWTNSHLISE